MHSRLCLGDPHTITARDQINPQSPPNHDVALQTVIRLQTHSCLTKLRENILEEDLSEARETTNQTASFLHQNLTHPLQIISAVDQLGIMSSNSPLSPPIFRLPPEIRLKIYRLLLLSDNTVRMVWLQDNDSYRRPNCLFPAILGTCHFIKNEAMEVLYGENVFRAHRINDKSNNAASIMRAKFVIGIINREDGEDDASNLASFLGSHPNLRDLVLEFGFDLLEDSDLRDVVSDALFTSGYSSRLIVRSYSQTKKSHLYAAQLIKMAEAMASIRNDSPGDLHPDTLESMSNLALVLTRQGKHEEAEAMQRRTLEGSEKVLGTRSSRTRC